MGIRKSTFSGYELTEDDAIAFKEQLKKNRSNFYSAMAIARGQALAKEYAKNGFAIIPIDRKGRVVIKKECEYEN